MSVVSVDRLRVRNPKIFKRCRRCGEYATNCGCRQGRNHESRNRSNKSKLLMEQHLRSGGLVSLYCPDCFGTDVDMDYTTGDTICINCGAVLDDGGLLAQGWNIVTTSCSKGYETLVYVREKIRSLHGTGKILLRRSRKENLDFSF